MAVAGSWRARAVTPAEYAGVTRQGTGVNPVHAHWDTTGRPAVSRLPLGQTGPGEFVPEEILGPDMWGYSSEDAATYPGEDYRYLETDHPNLGEQSAGRGDRADHGADQYAAGLAAWPPWGPAGAADPDFPLPVRPGGIEIRSQSHGSEIERHNEIAVPTRGSTGGWESKAHGPVLDARTSDPAQYEVATSMRQLRQQRVNAAAVARGTDDLRAAVATRLTGVKIRMWPKSQGMGGGPGTPDMRPVTQDLPYRPWYFREAAVPPAEAHSWNEMTQFTPVSRSVPADAGEQVSTAEADVTSGYGYAEGDWYG